jgi:PST family polysaccharide transporter
MPNFLIGRYYGSQALGHYDRGFHLAMMLPNQLIMPLYGPAISTFSRLIDDPDRYRRNFLKVISTLAFIGMPLSASICLISHDVVLMLLGPQWQKTGLIFLALGLSVGVIVIYISYSWLHFSLGTPDRLFRWSMIELVATFIGYLIGLSYGALGIAVAYSAMFYILIGPAFWYAGKPIGLKVFSVFSHVWKYFVSALASGICSWYILYSYDFTANIFSSLNIFIRIIASVNICLFFYLLLIVMLHQGFSPISQFIGLIRETINK